MQIIYQISIYLLNPGVWALRNLVAPMGGTRLLASPKTDFRSILDASVLDRFSQRGQDAAKRCRSPTGSTLRRSWCAKSSLSLRFYSVFQVRPRRPFWGPREVTDRYMVDLGPISGIQEGCQEAQNRRQIGPTRVKLSAETLQEAFHESLKTL